MGNLSSNVEKLLCMWGSVMSNIRARGILELSSLSILLPKIYVWRWNVLRLSINPTMKAVRLQSMQHYRELLLILHDIKSANSGGKESLRYVNSLPFTGFAFETLHHQLHWNFTSHTNFKGKSWKLKAVSKRFSLWLKKQGSFGHALIKFRKTIVPDVISVVPNNFIMYEMHHFAAG